MKRSRRQMLKLLAAGSAAVLAAPAAVLAETTAPARTSRRAPAASGTRRAPASPAVQAEVAKQKRDLLAALKNLRDYKLPDGSPAAFTFRPLRAARRGGRS
jgi:hypothetical protein